MNITYVITLVVPAVLFGTGCLTIFLLKRYYIKIMKYTNLINKEEFDKLTKEQKIAAICQDVIDRLTLSNLVANTGSFMPTDDTVIVNKTFINNQRRCFVCAKGAVFCSWVGNFNEFESVVNVKRNDFNWRRTPELLAIFGREMLDEIEISFEGKMFRWTTVSREDACVLVDYFKIDNFAHHNAQLIAIMQHIIDNNGKFNIEQMIDENHKRENL